MTKRSAFIGLSGPIGYDYRNPLSRQSLGEERLPNPVLEDVAGLLLCYDELIFLSRDFCPADMQDLPYVHFVNEHPGRLERARTARDQYAQLASDIRERWAPVTRDWHSIVFTMTQGHRDEFAIDHHTHTVHVAPDYEAHASAGNLENVIMDAGVALSLDAGTVDVVSNSIAAQVVNGMLNDLVPRGAERTKLSLANSVVNIRTQGFLTPSGSYHESIEELRQHARLKEFRELLNSYEGSEKEGPALAMEVTRLADEYAREGLSRFLKGRSRFVTVGSPLVGLAGNLLQPGFGSVLSGAVGAADFLRERKHRRRMAWALFVLDARARPSA
ncbi:hypothetical protein [Geodermatophilus nigrescens]|uniref:hypothetical protein n=1 Tax=Geodermatophilus nigrescens TaxID=1070870 RepID=UPI001114DF49|nr:hypothetical protein [Geodermatophilus nigrescens]